MTAGSQTSDNCHWCSNAIGYIYVEPNQEVKIIMQQQKTIDALNQRIAELEKQLQSYKDFCSAITREE